MKTAKFVRGQIEKAGGFSKFTSAEIKDRPVGCPMKTMLSSNHGWDDEEAEKLTKPELHIGFLIGTIKNNSRKQSIRFIN